MSNGTNGSGPGNANKDVIYIDVDDEITGVIDKVRSSENKIVALVLPKRSGAFQSIVNMRLLKRTADSAKKHVVLITGEASLLPLAGAVGMFVAKNLQSRPEIPPAPASPDSDEADEALMVDDAPSKAAAVDKTRSVGDLATSAAAAKDAIDEDDAIELDNTDLTPPASAAGGKKPKGKKGGKKLNVPNFNKFRLWLMLGGGGLALLIIVLIVCMVVLPKAKVTVKTDSVSIASNLDVTLSTTAKSVNTDANVVPAVSAQTQKTYTQQVDATGQRNDGTKASGSVTMTAGPCTGDAPSDIPAGTGISANGQTFLTQGGVTFTPSLAGGKCTFVSTNSTDVLAQNPGEAGNISATNFSVAGHSNVTAKSQSPMTGGTDKITKTIAQGDIDSAKQKLNSQDTTAVKQELQSSLRSKNLYVVQATLNSDTPIITSSANPGDVADNVTVTEKITYTMLGAKDTDLKKLIVASVNKQIDPKKQKILDDGLSKAVFNAQSQRADGSLVTMQTNSIAGSDLNIESLKKQIAGKKAADAKEIIKSNPSVTDAEVHYSPFWVSSIPKKTSKITIEIEKPAASNAKP